MELPMRNSKWKIFSAGEGLYGVYGVKTGSLTQVCDFKNNKKTQLTNKQEARTEYLKTMALKNESKRNRICPHFQKPLKELGFR